MTDEELFKAWKSEQYKDQSTEEKLEFVEHLHNFPRHFRKTFLAGLKAGRPQWHKVADGDLPEKEDVFLIYTTKGFLLGHYEQGGADGKVDYCGEPYSDFTEYPSEEELVANEVLAWCEIPTFDKE